VRLFIIFTFFLPIFSFADAADDARTYILQTSRGSRNKGALIKAISVWENSRRQDKSVALKLIEIMGWSSYKHVWSSPDATIRNIKLACASALDDYIPEGAQEITLLARSLEAYANSNLASNFYDASDYPLVAEILSVWATNDLINGALQDQAFAELVRAVESNSATKIAGAAAALAQLKRTHPDLFSYRDEVVLRIEKALNRPWAFYVANRNLDDGLFDLRPGEIESADYLARYVLEARYPVYALLQCLSSLAHDDRPLINFGFAKAYARQIRTILELYPELRTDIGMARYVLNAIKRLDLHDEYFDKLLFDFYQLSNQVPLESRQLKFVATEANFNEISNEAAAELLRIQIRFNYKLILDMASTKEGTKPLVKFFVPANPDAQALNADVFWAILNSPKMSNRQKLKFITSNLLLISGVQSFLLSVIENDESAREEALFLLDRAKLDLPRLRQLQRALGLWNPNDVHVKMSRFRSLSAQIISLPELPSPVSRAGVCVRKIKELALAGLLRVFR
jgi:hypothetical protein